MHDAVRRVAAPVALAATLAMLTGCGTSSGRQDDGQPGAHAAVGAITLTQGRVPRPASPQVGAAYFTLQNTGQVPDRLVSATSPAAHAVSAMSDVMHDNAMTMVRLPAIVIPPHAHVTLSPGGKHLMLQGLLRTLHVGDDVPVTLVFARAGRLTVRLPVVPLVASDGGDENMSNMPGM